MKEVFTGLFIAVVTHNIVKLLTLFFDNHYQALYDICKEILDIKRNYRDPRDFISDTSIPEVNKVQWLNGSVVAVGQVLDKLDIQKSLHPIMAFMLCETHLSDLLNLLYSYSSDAVLLPADRKFQELDRLNNRFFEKMESAAKRPLKLFKLYYFLFSILICIIGCWFLLKVYNI